MSTCIRNGNTYKRHKYVSGHCKFCKQPQPKKEKK